MTSYTALYHLCCTTLIVSSLSSSALTVFRLVSSARPRYIPGMPLAYGPHSSRSAVRPTAPRCRPAETSQELSWLLRCSRIKWSEGNFRFTLASENIWMWPLRPTYKNSKTPNPTIKHLVVHVKESLFCFGFLKKLDLHVKIINSQCKHCFLKRQKKTWTLNLLLYIEKFWKRCDSSIQLIFRLLPPFFSKTIMILGWKYG